MQGYLVRIECRSPYLTPWRCCTLWGRLCWVVADGRLPGWSIGAWAKCYERATPPLVVGDAFSEDAVPVPACFLAATKGSEKRPNTLPRADWLRLCETGEWPVEGQSCKARNTAVERMHVVISRETNTTVEGGLRTETGRLPSGGLVVFAMVDDLLGAAGLEALFTELCKEGWGQGRTYGYGEIALKGIEAIERPAPTRAVATLGHCHPTDNLPADGFWRWTGVPVRPHDRQTRRGEQEFFTTMLQPGATFKGTNAEVIGSVVSMEGRQDYQHYGLSPTWPIRWPEGS